MPLQYTSGMSGTTDWGQFTGGGSSGGGSFGVLQSDGLGFGGDTGAGFLGGMQNLQKLLGFSPLGGLLSGISSAFSSKSEKKESRKNRDFQRELVRMQGDEARKSALYGYQLQRYDRELQRSDKKKGFDNYKSYVRKDGASTSGLSTLKKMSSVDSANQVRDPGLAPPSPDALYERRQGWVTESSDPLYRIDPVTGQVVSALTGGGR